MNEPGSSPRKNNREDEKKRQEQNQRRLRFGVSYLITSLILLWLFQVFVLTPQARRAEIPYSEFKKKLAAAQIVKVTIGERGIVGEMKNPKPDGSPPVVPFNTVPAPAGDPKLIEELQNANATYRFEPPPSPLGGILLNLMPVALLGGFWYMAYRRAGGAAGAGQGGIFGVGRSKATEVKPEDVTVTYKDVGGADEAIAELQEIIQFLKTPEQFARLGGHIPKGVLLVGPPGHRQDAAGEGHSRRGGRRLLRDQRLRIRRDVRRRGAARVRDLFEQATRPLRRSSSSTRLMPSVRAAGAWSHAAATTSGSRPSTSCWPRSTASRPTPAPGDHHGCDQPPGGARPGTAARGPVRPPGGRGQSGPRRPGADPQDS